MSDIKYNVITIDISNGLNNREISIGDGNYFILQYAPSNANVRVMLGNNLNPEIYLMQNSGFEALGVDKIYINADAIPDAHITILHSKTSQDFRYIPPTYGKIDIGTVDAVHTVENVNFVNLVDSVNQIKNIVGSGGMSFETLINEYQPILSNDYFALSDEGVNEMDLNEQILEIEQKSYPELQSIDWDLFDYAYINAVINITSDVTEYGYVKCDMHEGSLHSYGYVYFIDGLDNNRNGGKQYLTQIFDKNFLKNLTDKTTGGKSLRYREENLGQNECPLSVILFKKPMDAVDNFILGNYVINLDSSGQGHINTTFDFIGSIPKYSTYLKVKVSFDINGVTYITDYMEKNNKDFNCYTFFNGIPIIDLNGTEVSTVQFQYHNNNKSFTIVANGSGGDNKVYVNNVFVTIDGYA
jgi:hypothetical protein